MQSRSNPIYQVVMGLLFAGACSNGEILAQASEIRPVSSRSESSNNLLTQSVRSPIAALPLEQLPQLTKQKIQAIIDRPTVRTLGLAEAFNCKPDQYYWLLDNPQHVVRLWRALGAKVTDVESHGDGHYSYRDEEGSHVTWDTIIKNDTHRLWVAEGKIKAGYFIPAISLKAIVAVHHEPGSDMSGNTAMKHQVEMIVQTDSHAIAFATKLLGASAPHLGEQFVGQIEMFFGAMAWFLDQHPVRAARLLAELEQPESRKVAPVKPASFLRSGNSGR